MTEGCQREKESGAGFREHKRPALNITSTHTFWKIQLGRTDIGGKCTNVAGEGGESDSRVEHTETGATGMSTV